MRDPVVHSTGKSVPEPAINYWRSTGIAAAADKHAEGCQDYEQAIEHGSTLVTDVMLG
jgi:hypothetical protein